MIDILKKVILKIKSFLFKNKNLSFSFLNKNKVSIKNDKRKIEYNAPTININNYIIDSVNNKSDKTDILLDFEKVPELQKYKGIEKENLIKILETASKYKNKGKAKIWKIKKV